MRTSVECLAKAVELEAKAEAFPAGRASYTRMAITWRDLGRKTAITEQQSLDRKDPASTA